MGRYIIRRLLQAIPLLFIISVILVCPVGQDGRSAGDVRRANGAPVRRTASG